jgi:hypothetical protein
MCDLQQEWDNSGGAALNTFERAGQSAISGLNTTIDKIARNPLPVIETIALTYVLGPSGAGLASATYAPIIANAAVSAANGGSMDKIALAAVSSMAGNYAAEYAGSSFNASDYAKTLDVQTAATLSKIVASSSSAAAQTAIQGGNLSKVLASAVTSSVATTIATNLSKQYNVSDAFTKKLVDNSVSAATKAILSGQNIGTAIGSTVASTYINSGLSKAADEIGSAYKDYQESSAAATAAAEQVESLQKALPPAPNADQIARINSQITQNQSSFERVVSYFSEPITRTNKYIQDATALESAYKDISTNGSLTQSYSNPAIQQVINDFNAGRMSSYYDSNGKLQWFQPASLTEAFLGQTNTYAVNANSSIEALTKDLDANGKSQIDSIRDSIASYKSIYDGKNEIIAKPIIDYNAAIKNINTYVDRANTLQTQAGTAVQTLAEKTAKYEDLSNSTNDDLLQSTQDDITQKATDFINTRTQQAKDAARDIGVTLTQDQINTLIANGGTETSKFTSDQVAQIAGFKNRTDALNAWHTPAPDYYAKLAGFKDGEEYTAAKAGGFTSPATWKDAQTRGVDNVADYKAVIAGFDNAQDQATAKAGGFTSSTAWNDAQTKGITNNADYIAIKAGFDNAADKTAANALKIYSATAWNDYQAKQDGWTNYAQQQAADKVGITDAKQYTTYLADQSAIKLGFDNAADQASAKAAKIYSATAWNIYQDKQAVKDGFDNAADQKAATTAGYTDPAKWNQYQADTLAAKQATEAKAAQEAHDAQVAADAKAAQERQAVIDKANAEAQTAKEKAAAQLAQEQHDAQVTKDAQEAQDRQAAIDKTNAEAQAKIDAQAKADQDAKETSGITNPDQLTKYKALSDAAKQDYADLVKAGTDPTNALNLALAFDNPTKTADTGTKVVEADTGDKTVTDAGNGPNVRTVQGVFMKNADGKVQEMIPDGKGGYLPTGVVHVFAYNEPEEGTLSGSTYTVDDEGKITNSSLEEAPAKDKKDKPVSEVDNGDGTFTLTMPDGSEKIVDEAGNPVTPTEPVTPTTPTEPTVPTTSTEPTTPSVTPTEPEKPVTPTAPIETTGGKTDETTTDKTAEGTTGGTKTPPDNIPGVNLDGNKDYTYDTKTNQWTAPDGEVVDLKDLSGTKTPPNTTPVTPPPPKVNPETPAPSAEDILQKAADDKALADKALADKAAADKIAADKISAAKIAAAKAAADKAAQAGQTNQTATSNNLLGLLALLENKAPQAPVQTPTTDIKYFYDIMGDEILPPIPGSAEKPVFDFAEGGTIEDLIRMLRS